MAIGGIGSYGVNSSFLNYQSSINQMKLHQALSKSTGSKGYSNQGSIGNIMSSALSDSTSYLSKYDKSMSDLMSAANSLRSSNSSGVFNEVTASSSDEKLMSATANYKLKAGESYDISISQMAEAQVNQSNNLNSYDGAAGNASMAIQTAKGAFDINVSATNANGVRKTNKEMLTDVAAAINGKKAGVTASVVTEKGVSSLKITGDETGQKNGFSVSGSYAQQIGVDTATKSAQDAMYSVRENGGEARNYTSDSNNISLNFGKITGTIKGTGDVKIVNGADNKKITSAVEKLVNSYNDTVNLLSANAERGGGTARQLQGMMSNPTSKRSLELIGITANKDGTLSLDKDKLSTALTEKPDIAKDIIGGSFGLAQGAYNKAESGLAKSSDSLISNDLKAAEKSVANDTTTFLARYSRSGAYNVMNYYAVGMMMNYLA